VIPRTGSLRVDGLHPVHIDSLPASTGRVILTASPDLGAIAADLAQRKYKLPSATITIGRESPQIFVLDTSAFCRDVAGKLAAAGVITVVDAKGDADYFLQVTLMPSAEVQGGASGLYRARSMLSMQMLSRAGRKVVDTQEEVTSSDARSAEEATGQTRSLAIGEAVKRIRRAF
jgi:hypothetical protein